MTNVVLPPSVWVDLYAAPGTPSVGTAIDVVNITPNDARLVSSAAEPAGTDDHIPVLFRGSCVKNNAADPGAWALCVGGGAVDVVAS